MSISFSTGRSSHLSAFRSDMLDVRQKLPFLRNKNAMLIGGGEALRFELPPQAASAHRLLAYARRALISALEEM